MVIELEVEEWRKGKNFIRMSSLSAPSRVA